MKKIEKISNLTDIELCLNLANNSDRAELAFTEIYNRYSNTLYAYILRSVNNRNDAKDIFQETFIRFYNFCKNGNRVTNILPFVLKIARNLCLNYYRDKKSIVSFDETTGILPSFIDIEKNEVSQMIENALAMLDFLSREVFVLHHYQNLTFSEIAEIVGESLATVKSRYYRGREKLKAILMPFIKNDY
ncbi:MAG: RNA polymerase sigma factor [Candidatus Kapaibacteriota bacterium]